MTTLFRIGAIVVAALVGVTTWSGDAQARHGGNGSCGSWGAGRMDHASSWRNNDDCCAPRYESNGCGSYGGYGGSGNYHHADAYGGYQSQGAYEVGRETYTGDQSYNSRTNQGNSQPSLNDGSQNRNAPPEPPQPPNDNASSGDQRSANSQQPSSPPAAPNTDNASGAEESL